MHVHDDDDDDDDDDADDDVEDNDDDADDDYDDVHDNSYMPTPKLHFQEQKSPKSRTQNHFSANLSPH